MAQWQSAEVCFLSFSSFILHTASLSHPLPIVWWPSVTVSYWGSPSLSVPPRQPLVSHPAQSLPFHPIKATCPEFPFSSDDLCTKRTKSTGLANWSNTKRYKIICRISGPRAALGKEREAWPSQVASWLSWLSVTFSSLSCIGLQYEFTQKAQSGENKDQRGATLYFSRMLAADTKRAVWSRAMNKVDFSSANFLCKQTHLICYLSMDDCIFRKNCSKRT